MLVEFRVANHRSLRDEQVLTMEAGRVGDETDLRPRHVPGHSERHFDRRWNLRGECQRQKQCPRRAVLHV